MVLLVGIHMGQVFLMGCYKYPREFNWLTGAVLRGQLLQAAHRVGGDDRGSGANVERFEVAANQRGRWRMILDEHDLDGTAAKRLDADGSGTGKDVDKARTVHCAGQDIE